MQSVGSHHGNGDGEGIKQGALPGRALQLGTETQDSPGLPDPQTSTYPPPEFKLSL